MIGISSIYFEDLEKKSLGKLLSMLSNLIWVLKLKFNNNIFTYVLESYLFNS